MADDKIMLGGDADLGEASGTQYPWSEMRSTLPETNSPANTREFLSTLREMERNPKYAEYKTRVQTQHHALGILRNLLGAGTSGAVQDRVMNKMGSERVYGMVTKKLSPVPSTLTGGKIVYEDKTLVLDAIHIIIHLANPSGKHRTMLMAQKPLLQALLPHFHHTDADVRVIAVWAVNSMTWIEDDEDKQQSKQRKQLLQTLGYEQTIRALQDDPSPDVRARVQTALEQIGKM